MAPLYFKEPKLCVVSHLTEYLKRTKSYRDTYKLFLTCIKPYRVASKDTIFRWCKSITKESGISFIGTPLIHLELQLHPMRSPVDHRYPQSSRLQFGNQRRHLPNLTNNKSKKKLSFKIICCRIIKLHKKIIKVYLYKKCYRVLIVKEMLR